MVPEPWPLSALPWAWGIKTSREAFPFSLLPIWGCSLTLSGIGHWHFSCSVTSCYGNYIPGRHNQQLPSASEPCSYWGIRSASAAVGLWYRSTGWYHTTSNTSTADQPENGVSTLDRGAWLFLGSPFLFISDRGVVVTVFCEASLWPSQLL